MQSNVPVKRLSISSILKNQVLMAFIISVCIFLAMGLANPKSINNNAVSSILAFTTMLAFATAGQTIVVISGGEGVDLSVGSAMSLGAILAAETMYAKPEMILPAFLVCIAAGIAVGLLNAAGVVGFGLPPLIMTLCVSSILTRIQFIITKGTPYGTSADELTATMTYRFFGIIPSIVIYGLVFSAIVYYTLNRSRFGLQLFLTGNNETAAYLAGIRTNRVKVTAYVLCSVLSSIGGFVACGYYHHVSCVMLDQYTMTSLAAVVIGGTTLAGGKGSYFGSVVGALVLTVLGNFLVVLNTSNSIRDIVMGAVLILLLAAYNRSKSIRH